MFDGFKRLLDIKKRKSIIRYLHEVNPEKLMKMGEKEIIPAFTRASSRLPAYKQILIEKKVNAEGIKDIISFRKLAPIITKNDIFPRFGARDLCLDGNFGDVESIMLSSGFSGSFSIDMSTGADHRNLKKMVDFGLQLGFNIDGKKTLLINTLPMGVRVETSIPIAETSVREDLAVGVIGKFNGNFEQILVIGDPNFLKKLLEYGIENGIDWHKLNVSLISGGDFITENMRVYLETLIGANSAKGNALAITMGITELGMNLFHETEDTIKIRKLLVKDKSLYKALFGDEQKLIPLIMHYYPNRVFLESVPDNCPDSDLVFSMLSPALKTPLIRYSPGDCGKIFQYSEIKKILIEKDYPDFIPKLKLPIVALFGRRNNFVNIGGIKFFSEEVSEILYADFDVAKSITGNFVINKSGLIEIQLGKKYTDILPKLKKLFYEYKGIVPKMKIYGYSDFPYQRDIDYERKFRHIY